MQFRVCFTKGFFLIIAFCFLSCTKKQGPIGAEDNPIKFYVVPSVDVKVLEDSTKKIKIYLESHTPYKYKMSIPASYVAVVEAFGTKRADVASINTFGYILAHEKYGAEARMTLLRFGEATYQAQIIARADGPIKSLQDINGKKFAFVDPASASGFLLPQKLFRDLNIKPKETMFAMRHDSVVSMVYQGQVDAGATYYSPKQDGKLQDARRLVLTQFPDVEDKVKILKLTEPVPNDPFVFRKELPEEIKQAIIKALFEYIETPEGKVAFDQVAGVNGLRLATDKDYDGMRAILKELGKSAAEMVK